MGIVLGDQSVFCALTGDVCGVIAGKAFPRRTVIKTTGQFDFKGGSWSGVKWLIVYPDKTSEEITNNDIKCATLLGMGNATIRVQNQDREVPITKYLMILNDGRQGIITSYLFESQYILEALLF